MKYYLEDNEMKYYLEDIKSQLKILDEACRWMKIILVDIVLREETEMKEIERILY